MLVNPIGRPYVVQTTWADLIANYPSTNYAVGSQAFVTDLGLNGSVFVASSSRWEHISQGASWNIFQASTPKRYLLIGGSGGTYSQTGTTITVTLTHTITADQNGAGVHLTIGTGASVTGWFTNFTYISPTQFSVTSAVSQSTSGNLGSNTAETYIPFSHVIPSGLLDYYLDLIAMNSAAFSSATAGTKTFRTYFNSALLSPASTQTSAGQYTTAAPSVISALSASLFYQASSSNTSVARGNNTYTFSMQLSSSTDWAILSPQRLLVAQTGRS